MARNRTAYRCNECGDRSPKWAGRCDACGEWNSMAEEPPEPTTSVNSASVAVAPSSPAVPIDQVPRSEVPQLRTGVAELDRVLGGGFACGSVTLIGGEPGIGKSTLLLQALSGLATVGRPVLYVTGEESAEQVRDRAERVGALRPHLLVAAETALPTILGQIEASVPTVVAIDSIQTVWDPELTSAPGSVGQVRHCAHVLTQLAKERGVVVVLVGHVTKDGALAGPRVLEHIVDTVLSFDGDRHHGLRFLRAVKHRFGPTHDVGLFEMGTDGLMAVEDASGMFLADRRPGTAGSVVVPTLEGRRPLLAEVQALVVGNPGGTPRRNAQGVDSGRVSIVLAVLDRHCGVRTVTADTHVVAVGGARVHEPTADLGLALAIASSAMQQPVPSGVVACGEVGLGGELRSVAGIDRRLREAARLGFEQAVVPASTPAVDVDIQLYRVPTLVAALAVTGLSTVSALHQQ